MRTFVARRHQRHKRLSMEWRSRQWRRVQRAIADIARVVRRWILWVMLGFAALCGAILLFFPVFDVREIRIEKRDPRIDEETVQKALAPLFHRQLSFLTERDAEEPLRRVMPDLDSVRVRKEYVARRLSLSIALHPLLWQLQIESPGGAPPPRSGSGAALPAPPSPRRDFLTVRGLYVTAPPPSTAVVLPVVRIVDWGVRPTPGTQLLPIEMIERVQDAEAALREEFGLTVKSRTIFLRAREFHLQVGSVALWFDLQSPLAEQIGRYRLFLATVGKNEVKEYVDLRLSGRVVYR